MLRILYRLDKTDTVEANLVAEASNRLGVGEFQFFRLAHQHWFGQELEPESLEPAFLGYMLQDNVPHFVRQFARNVIRRDNAGLLDPEDEEFHRFDAVSTRATTRSGLLVVTLVLLVTAVFIGLNIYTYTPEMAEGERCSFPPCPNIGLRGPP